MAPRDRLESRLWAGWLTAGVRWKALLRKKSPDDPPFLDSLFGQHGLGPIAAREGPNQGPGSLKALGGLGCLVLGIVILPETAIQVVGLAAVKAAGGFATADIDPEGHPVVPGSKEIKESPAKAPGFGVSWLPVCNPRHNRSLSPTVNRKTSISTSYQRSGRFR